MKYLVKIKELNDVNSYLEENMNQIKSDVQIMKDAIEGLNWSSSSYDIFLSKYKDYIDNLEKMNIKLESCLNINKKFVGNFSEGYKKIQNNFKKISDDMEERWKTQMR